MAVLESYPGRFSRTKGIKEVGGNREPHVVIVKGGREEGKKREKF